ncbi:MAG: molybdenum cofactor guanylyltransferase [Bacteroidetes bacterium]|nr:molybdenum cofactor guanylyltransferase [Bacteroidota bacterium]
MKDKPGNTDLHIVIACGGRSSRMGTDKYLLEYHCKPQYLYLYETLSPLCNWCAVSCNAQQTTSIKNNIVVIEDLPAYADIGPMAALLTAFSRFPDNDVLLVGCDYPFISAGALEIFLQTFSRSEMAAAFYNEAQNIYEPLLAFYNCKAKKILAEMFAQEDYSLQKFLKKMNAVKYLPPDNRVIQSVDTVEQYEMVKRTVGTKHY